MQNHSKNGYKDKEKLNMTMTKNDQVLHFIISVMKQERVKYKTCFWFYYFKQNRLYLFLSSQRLFLPTLFNAFVTPRNPKSDNDRKTIESNMI